MSIVPRPTGGAERVKWTVEGSEIVRRDRWISLRADRCVNARGVPVAPYYVLEYPDWVNVLAVTENQQVVLVRQYRHGVGEVCLELPGGAVDPGEHPAAALRRELLEETGFEAGTLESTVVLTPNPATHTNRVHSFVARACRRVTAPQLDATEDIEVVTMPLAEFVDRLLEGECGQAMHFASAMAGLRALGVIRVAARRDAPTD